MHLNLNPDSTMEQTKKYPTINWTKNEYHQLKLAVDALKAICAREDKRHQMDEHLDPHTRDVIEEVKSACWKKRSTTIQHLISLVNHLSLQQKCMRLHGKNTRRCIGNSQLGD